MWLIVDLAMRLQMRPSELAQCDWWELSLMVAWRKKRLPEKEWARRFGKVCATLANVRSRKGGFVPKNFFEELAEPKKPLTQAEFEKKLVQTLLSCNR